MRVKIGITGILGMGLSVTVALAQAPAQRGARLLPPRAADAEDIPVYARAAAEPLPQFPQSTPVKQTTTPTAGPAWLHDSGIRQVAGTTTDRTPPRSSAATLPNNGVPREEGSFVSKGLDKLKNTFSGERPERPTIAIPTSTAGIAQPGADTPFRSTTPNGQPIYAGPPAYRWYGWGSVTPGANPYAPTGFSPKASAAWFTITGATPGAFPVTVTEGQRNLGTEPPAYVPSPPPRTVPGPTTVPASANYVPPMSAPMRQPVPNMYPVPRTGPGTSQDVPRVGMPPVDNRIPPTPTITVPPGFGAATPPAPVVLPVTVPTISPPPTVATGIGLSPTAEPEQHGTQGIVAAPYTLAPMLPHPGVPVPNPTPIATLPGDPTPLPTTTVESPPAPAALAPDVLRSAAAPTPLPVTVTEEQPKWLPNTTGGGDPQSEQKWKQPGATETTRSREVARAQTADEKPNSVNSLIQSLCVGRASGVELRWTGTNRVAVNLVCRNLAEARQLANDISARPELVDYRIDFSVQVK